MRNTLSIKEVYEAFLFEGCSCATDVAVKCTK